jgi:hypothetical protein
MEALDMQKEVHQEDNQRAKGIMVQDRGKEKATNNHH